MNRSNVRKVLQHAADGKDSLSNVVLILLGHLTIGYFVDLLFG